MSTIYEQVPAELKALRQWVCFMLADNPEKGKPDKIPISPRTLTGAKANDPTTWTSFAEAEAALGKQGSAYVRRKKEYILVTGTLCGVGFEFASGYFGVDIDHVEEAIADYRAGGRENIVAEFVEGLASYAEYSPSGTGIHILCRGSIPSGGNRRGNVEMYQAGRYFTVTGNPVSAEYLEITDCTERIKPLFEKYLGTPPKPKPVPMPLIPATMADEELLQKILDSAQGGKFSELFTGNWEGRFPSQSEAEMSLCEILAFWCGRDTARMDRIFRRSGLMREKWDEQRGQETYGAMTVRRAAERCAAVYNPDYHRTTALEDFLRVADGEKPRVEVILDGEIPGYSKEEYLNSTAPFDFVYAYRDDAFRKKAILTRMGEAAKKVGVTNFKTLYAAFEKSKATAEAQKLAEEHTEHITRFPKQPMELSTGEWIADHRGVRRGFGAFEEVACPHPILPVLRLVNIDTGAEKLKLAFYRGRYWRTVIADKRTIASNTQIVSLADQGIGVTSENAKSLVRYLSEMESLNYDRLPEKTSVSRLGWIEGQGFSPYVDNLEFDGDQNFRAFFESVQARGSREEWLRAAREARQGSVQARIMLAASFASVLVKPLGSLPFFVHLWGGTELGKTVALMLAASVWADPRVGRYVHTFNSTAVGREKSAAFVNSMPLILDELQIVADRRSFDKDIMLLAEGAGRTRGNKNGGVDKTPTWANCILTNGEDPITTASSGGGAVNRIVDVECTASLFADARSTAGAVRENYGHAGRMFVERLTEKENIRRASEAYERYYRALCQSDTTEKQAGAVALILAADELATEWIFQDGAALAPSEFESFLRTKGEVSNGERAYEFIVGFAVQNRNKLCMSSSFQEVWGRVDGRIIYLLSAVFNKACEDAGYNPGSLKSWLRNHGKLLCDRGRLTKKARVNGISADCVAFQMEEDFDPGEYEEIPVNEGDCSHMFP